MTTIKSFNDKHIDTTILTIGRIDNNNILDTISTEAYLKNKCIHMESKWYLNDSLIWREHIINPYMWISNDSLFISKHRDLWIKLTIAIFYSIPELIDKSEYSEIGNSFIFPNLKSDSKQSMLNYYSTSKNQLFIHGEPENRNVLYIWNDLTNDFIIYYAP